MRIPYVGTTNAGLLIHDQETLTRKVTHPLSDVLDLLRWSSRAWLYTDGGRSNVMFRILNRSVMFTLLGGCNDFLPPFFSLLRGTSTIRRSRLVPSVRTEELIGIPL